MFEGIVLSLKLGEFLTLLLPTVEALEAVQGGEAVIEKALNDAKKLRKTN